MKKKYYVILACLFLLFSFSLLASTNFDEKINSSLNKPIETKSEQENSSNINSILTTLLGSLLGALLAIPAGLWLDRKIKKKEASQSIMSLNTQLISELTTNLKTIESFLNNTDNKFEVPDLINSAWQIAVAKDYMSLSMDIDLVQNLSKTYNTINNLEFFSNNYYKLLILGDSSIYGYNEKINLINSKIKAESIKSKKLIEIVLTKLNGRF